MTQHTQVPFRLLNGKVVGVDKGLKGILVALRNNGIKTQYSCEDNMGSAYIVMPLWSGFKFLRLIRGTFFYTMFVTGRRTVEISHFREKGTRRMFEFTFLLPGRLGRGWRVEYLISKHYGLRMSIRWPARLNAELEHTLGGI